jgi:acyl-coenzyme A thioesterase PaaI-like protein
MAADEVTRRLESPSEPGDPVRAGAQRGEAERSAGGASSARAGPRRTGPHLNQPGGPFHASTHPAIRGRERELRALADALRRLIAIAVTHTAPASDTADAAHELQRIAERLERFVPTDPPPRYAPGPVHPHDFFQYDVVLGLYNPLALPIEMEWEPPRALGYARFTTPYEGPPGCVHGAVLAGAFDQVFNVANLKTGRAGPTRELVLRYLRPTPLHADLIFEGWIERIEGREITTVGHVRHGEVVTVEARGLFIEVSRERVYEMAARAKPGGTPTP